MGRYEWTPAMVREISGFGGAYEAWCRRALVAALNWIDEQPERPFTPWVQQQGELNADARELADALDVEYGAVLSLAMFAAICNAVCWIRKHGWDRYVAEKSRPVGAA